MSVALFFLGFFLGLIIGFLLIRTAVRKNLGQMKSCSKCYYKSNEEKG